MSEEIYDPRERLEIFLNAIRTGDVEDLPDPQTREEMYLLAIASKGALPDPTDASAGDALVLDTDKNPTWAQPAAKLYHHCIALKYHFAGGGTANLGDGCYFLNITNDREAAYTDYEDIKSYLTGKSNYPISGWRMGYSNTSTDKFIKSIFLSQTIDAANNYIAGVNIAFTSGAAPQTITVTTQTFGASNITSIYDYVS